MFEEAWTFAVSARTASTVTDHGHLWHQSDCSLYYWTSPGKLRGRGALLFLYVEYRGANGDARYTRMQFQDPASLQVFLQSHLPYWPLQGLDAAKTRARPVKNEAPAAGAPKDTDQFSRNPAAEQWKTGAPATI